VKPRSIAAINQLKTDEQLAIYSRFIPPNLLSLLKIPPDFIDQSGRPLLRIQADQGQSDTIIELRHRVDAQDPALFVHLTDTINLQIHVLLYVVNDPYSERFDVDKMPDGTPTVFGTSMRNIEAEIASMAAGLAPGQIRQGLHIFRDTLHAFEEFVASLDHDLYLVEPLYYHNAVIFEQAGCAYIKGRRFMERIDSGFVEGQEFSQRLDRSTPFRSPAMANSILGRSWAIHDGLLGEPFTEVTMYKSIGKLAHINTFTGEGW
jgi:hypothetical protein